MQPIGDCANFVLRRTLIVHVDQPTPRIDQRYSIAGVVQCETPQRDSFFGQLAFRHVHDGAHSFE